MKADLTAEYAKRAPWVFQFRIDGHDYGGAISAAGDARLERFLSLCTQCGGLFNMSAG